MTGIPSSHKDSLYRDFLEERDERAAYLANALHDLDVLKSQIIDNLPDDADEYVRTLLLGLTWDVAYSIARASG